MTAIFKDDILNIVCLIIIRGEYYDFKAKKESEENFDNS